MTPSSRSSAHPSHEIGDGRVQLVLDAATVVTSIFVATALHAKLQGVIPALRALPSFAEHTALVYTVLPMWLALDVMFRVHTAVAERIGHAELAARLVKLHLTGFAGLALIQFLTQAVINRSLVLLFLSCTFVLMYAERLVLMAWADFQYVRGIGRERVLLVGHPSKRVAQLMASFAIQRHAPHVVGYLDVPGANDGLSTAPIDPESLTRLGTLADLSRILHEQPVDHVLFFPPANRPEDLQAQLASCEELGVRASFSVDLIQVGAATPRITSKYEHAFVTFEVSPKRPDVLAIKHGLDPIFAGIAILVLSPVFLLTALAILISMGRPITFSQQRAGLYGRPFRMFKFRSMTTDAEAQREAIAHRNEMSGPVFKIRDDPRATPLGHFLRQTSLDELPQLFNVLLGSMSLVGPRPLPVSEQAQIQGWQRRRLSMKPGITCLWQVGGRNDVDFVDWMLLDLKYVDEWSLWLDLQILLRTIPAVLFRPRSHGAQTSDM